MKPWPVTHADAGVVIVSFLVIIMAIEFFFIIRNR